MGLSQSDASRRLGVHRNTIAAWLRAGKLTSDGSGGVAPESIEQLESAFAEYRARVGPAMDLADLLNEWVGGRTGQLHVAACALAEQLVALRSEILSRGDDPDATTELQESLTSRIRLLGALADEQRALEHTAALALQLATARAQATTAGDSG